ncbi:MAG: sigma-E factor negative regulatory protein [Pseudomonadota bacterium]
MSGDFSKVHSVESGTTRNVASSTGDAAQLQTADQAILLESVSALMDDRADELELRRILKAMPSNAELAAKWQRFHMVRGYLQQEVHSRPAVNLLDGINARLLAESVSLPKQTLFQSLSSNTALRYIGQGVIAASFFAITIMATSVFNQSSLNVQPAVADTAANLDTPVLGGEYKGSELSRTASLDSTLDEEALARLRQAVDREFSDSSTAQEIPVSYNLEFPQGETPNQ